MIPNKILTLGNKEYRTKMRKKWKVEGIHGWNIKSRRDVLVKYEIHNEEKISPRSIFQVLQFLTS